MQEAVLVAAVENRFESVKRTDCTQYSGIYQDFDFKLPNYEYLYHEKVNKGFFELITYIKVILFLRIARLNFYSVVTFFSDSAVQLKYIHSTH